MKNRNIFLLMMATALFVGFIFGFLTGRRTSGETVFVAVPDAMMTLPEETAETTSEICFPIDLNTAGKEEIMALPGIGEKMTLRIMAYRWERRKFAAVEDLLNVEGMTKKMLENIRDLVYVGG